MTHEKTTSIMCSPPAPRLAVRLSAVRTTIVLIVAVCVQAILLAPQARSQEFAAGNYLWYVPEHEKYGRTAFYTQPNFNSAQVRVTRAQRFKMLDTRRGWSAIEFDVAGRAYVHIRLLRTALYDPGAVDPYHEYQRASIFTEEPSKIEARLKGPSPAPVQGSTDSKVPAWKRYKDAWNLKNTRPTQPGAEDPPPGGSARTPGAGPEKKSRSAYPLLPPIGSEPGPPQGAQPQDSPRSGSAQPAP